MVEAVRGEEGRSNPEEEPLKTRTHRLALRQLPTPLGKRSAESSYLGRPRLDEVSLVKDDSEMAALAQVVEFCRREREGMTIACNNILSILDGKRIEGTTIDEEFTRFVGHFGNLKGFMSKHYQELSQPTLELARMGLNFGATDMARENLYELLSMPIDLSKGSFKKVSGAIKALGAGVGFSAEK
jgi:hypothetical protein